MCKWIKSGENRIDPCIKEVIENLNSAGVQTCASCCGHKIYHKTIVVKNRYDKNIEYFSGVKIPREKRFYIRDKNGMLFIPEVEQKYE